MSSSLLNYFKKRLKSIKKLLLILIIFVFNDSQSSNIELLSIETKRNILSFLPVGDIISVAHTSRHFHEVAKRVVEHLIFRPKSISISADELTAAANPITIFRKIKIEKIALNHLQIKEITSNPNIVFLHIGQNSKNRKNTASWTLQNNILKNLAESLLINKNLQTINITNSKLKSKGIKYLGNSLKKGCGIIDLGIFNCEISDNGIKLLTENFDKTTNLKRILLSSNSITDKGISYLTNFINQTSSLETLDLSLNDFTDDGVKILAQALNNNKSIKVLKLSGRPYPRVIGDKGAQALSEVINKTSIVHLNLARNKIQNQGAEYLAIALGENQFLTTLDLGVNKIENKGVVFLCEALKKNNKLVYLGLYGNPINYRELQDKAEEILKINSCISPSSFQDIF